MVDANRLRTGVRPGLLSDTSDDALAIAWRRAESLFACGRYSDCAGALRECVLAEGRFTWRSVAVSINAASCLFETARLSTIPDSAAPAARDVSLRDALSAVRDVLVRIKGLPSHSPSASTIHIAAASLFAAASIASPAVNALEARSASHDPPSVGAVDCASHLLAVAQSLRRARLARLGSHVSSHSHPGAASAGDGERTLRLPLSREAADVEALCLIACGCGHDAAAMCASLSECVRVAAHLAAGNLGGCGDCMATMGAELSPDTAFACLLKGHVTFALGNLRSARTLFDRCHDSPHANIAAVSRYMSALCHLHEGRSSAALALFRGCLGSDGKARKGVVMTHEGRTVAVASLIGASVVSVAMAT
eukprot:Opistho-2@73951